MRSMHTLILAGLLVGSRVWSQSNDVRYNCTAKEKKGAGDAASVVTAKSESGAVAAMKQRWPGYSSYVCSPAH